MRSVFRRQQVCLINNLSDTFPVQNTRKQGDALSTIAFYVQLECTVKKAQEYLKVLQWHRTHQFLVRTFDVNLLGKAQMP
jgi:hypothetical protein